jgi:hypothetical protein
VRLKKLLMTGPAKGLVAVAAVGALALANAAPAAAALPGAGAFSGYEIAPASNLYGFPPIINGPVNVLCANFTPTAAAPLTETVFLTGTFNGLTITPPGTAVFTDSGTSYDASPLGTFASGSLCLGVPTAVPGTLTVDVTGDHCVANSASYTRIGSNVAIESTGLNCTNAGSATIVLTGVEVPTSLVPVLTGPDANLAGSYVQA